MKWILVLVLAIIGVLAAVVAIIYFTVPIHSLPSFIPGHRHIYGHYRKRGAGAALVAVVALVAAVVLGLRFRRQDAGTGPGTAAPASAGDLLAGPGGSPGPGAPGTPPSA